MKESNKGSDVNRLNRYIWLLSTIKNNPGITRTMIEEKWMANTNLNPDGKKICRKTFHNYLISISELFDIDIVCDKAKNTYSVENENNSSDWKFKKILIESFSVKQILDNNPDAKKLIVFEESYTDTDKLNAIANALNGKIIIEIEYQSYDYSSPRTIRIKPLCLKNFKQQWYLIAYKEQNGTDIFRTYALNRIKRITPTNEPFTVTSNFDPDEHFKNSFGIMRMEDKSPVLLKILACEEKAKYLRAVPLHNTQEEINTIGDKYLFTYRIYPSFDLQMELLRHGDQIEIIAPDSFRKQISDIINNMNLLYK